MACRCVSGASTPPPRCIGVDQIIGGIVEEAWLLCAQVHSAARSGDELGCDGGGRALQGAAKKGRASTVGVVRYWRNPLVARKFAVWRVSSYRQRLRR